MKIHTKKILLNDTTATHRVLAMRERERVLKSTSIMNKNYMKKNMNK